MTQIKLRRDTSAAFASSNPILGNGEPAYETDTKKLKIGDGTTAYTQLEYFSAGGGGSTNITATLPLKIVDGVISLEVDGQTIQIVDGKLHANLDELGNEVNGLSGRVAAVEADIANKASKSDLAAKQDKLSPIAPLVINQTTISNVTDGTFLTDTSVTLNSEFYINYTTDANARLLITASGVSGGATPTSFIQIPFTLGDLVSFPDESNGDSKIGLVFGYWKEGLFYPTMLYKTYTTYGSGSNSYAPFAFVSEAGKSSLERIATYYGQSSAVNKSTLEYHESIPLNATNYIQVTKNAGVPTVNMWFTTSGASYPNRGYTQRMSTSDTTVLENFNKTNVCLLLSRNKSKAINLTKVTRRELGDTVLSPTGDALTTALSTHSNSFDATAKVVTNDLSLAIGSGLAITDGKLTASSTAPTNMVTTDTAQTITGLKTFGGTDLSKILLEGSGSLINFRENIDSLPTTLIGGFFDSNGKKSITIGSTDHETLSLNAKSVQDGSGNKFLTSGNVTAYVTETYVNGTSWYRVWSDGWCEQGGKSLGTDARTINLLKTFANTNYTASASLIGTDGAYISRADATLSTFAPSSFKIDYKTTSAEGVGKAVGYFWQVSGYIK